MVLYIYILYMCVCVGKEKLRSKLRILVRKLNFIPSSQFLGSIDIFYKIFTTRFQSP